MQSRRTRLLLTAAVVALLGAAAVQLVNRFKAGDVVTVESLADSALPELLQRLRNFHRVVTRDGHKLLEVSAKEASFFRETSAVEIIEPKVVFFDKGERVGEISGGRGTMVVDEGNVSSVEVTGGVRLAFVQFEIRADGAFYDREADLVITHGQATLRSDEFEVSGTGMTVDLKGESLRISEGVNMRVFRSKSAYAPGEAKETLG
jgi:LPS export ABC transporter protein LptC